MVTFRRAGPEDAAAVRDLTRAAYTEWVPVIGREPKPMVADYDRSVRDHRFDCALEDGRLVGLIEMILRVDDVLIENLAVSPDQQGKGLGRALLGRAEDVAREAGRPILRLYTNVRFEENVAFYQKRGFVVDAQEAIADGAIVHMSKPVSQATAVA